MNFTGARGGWGVCVSKVSFSVAQSADWRTVAHKLPLRRWFRAKFLSPSIGLCEGRFSKGEKSDQVSGNEI